jgi:hypothetical protein
MALDHQFIPEEITMATGNQTPRIERLEAAVPGRHRKLNFLATAAQIHVKWGGIAHVRVRLCSLVFDTAHKRHCLVCSSDASWPDKRLARLTTSSSMEELLPLFSMLLINRNLELAY